MPPTVPSGAWRTSPGSSAGYANTGTGSSMPPRRSSTPGSRPRPGAKAPSAPFLAWAAERGSAPAPALPPHPAGSSPTAVGAEDRWALARRLLHDDTIDIADRVAGAFAVIYAQPVARIARLSRADVTETAEGVLVRFGSDHVQMPKPLDDLVRQLPSRRQIGPSGTVAGDWLFPGRQAGQHQHPEYLRRRLGALGIDCRANRNAALLQLAATVPAAVLADTLGIDAKTAVRWTKTAGGDWTRYAAQRTADDRRGA